MEPGTCQATYLLGLSKAHALQEQSVAAKTLQQRHKNARELADWLQSTNIGRTLYSCLPEDIMVYLTTNWLPRHAGADCREILNMHGESPTWANGLVRHRCNNWQFLLPLAVQSSMPSIKQS